MMKVLLAEYASAHDPSLAAEGAAMLAVLKQSFERCGYDVVLPGKGDFGAEIGCIAPSCDMGLVIAPDYLLARYTQILEQHTHNLGCGFMTVALCANKVQTEKILRSHDVPVPAEASTGKRVIKPVKGCGATGCANIGWPDRSGGILAAIYCGRALFGEYCSKPGGG